MDGNACTTDGSTGDAAACSLVCTFEPIVGCADGDGCCPGGCTVATDSDCSPFCGDGVVGLGETCDGACPSECDDDNACTLDALTGAADTCSAACSHQAVAVCADADDCCPAGCNANTDDDCSPTCGNDSVEEGETCDGDCPRSCDDGDACTIDLGTGSAEACSFACTTEPNVECADDDGCCPAGCSSSTDDDCPLAAVGDACAIDADCASDWCGTQELVGLPGGYCLAQCAGEQDCDATSHCSNGTCLRDCASDGDCRAPSYECFDSSGDGVDECAPVGGGAGGIGAACEATDDCAGGQGAVCITEANGFPGGYCTIFGDCMACPVGSRCGQFGICVQGCEDADDCRAGYACADVDGDLFTECWLGP